MTKDQLQGLSGPQLVEVYNKLNPKYPVTKFSSRDAGIKRILDFQIATGNKADTPKEGIKPAKQKSEKAPKVPKEKKERKAGVIDTMVKVCEVKGGATKDEILDVLVKEFPDRTREGMAITVSGNMNSKQPKYGKRFERFKESGKPTRFYFNPNK